MRVTTVLMGVGEVCLEVDPRFVGDRMTTPFAAGLREDASAEYQIISNVDNLLWAVGCCGGSRYFDGIFELRE